MHALSNNNAGDVVSPPAIVEDARASWFETFPAFTQGFLTWLSAKPHVGQPPSTHSPTGYLAASAGTIAAGLAMFFLGASLDSWALRIIAIALVTSGLRKLQVVVFHHCSHGTVFRSRLANTVLGESISAIVLIKSFAAYRRDHIRHHSSKHLLTDADETVQFLVYFARLEPGLTRRQLWRRMLLNFANPLFHLRWLSDRVVSCFLVDGGPWRIARVAYWLVLLSVVTWAGAWRGFALAWVLPLTVCYNVSATLRLAAEHRWPTNAAVRSRARDFVCETTVAVFLGAPLPRVTGWRRLYALPVWALRMVGHLLARVLVLVGDTPCHDYHHRRPSSREWPNAIFARQADLERGCPGYPQNYGEVWGLFRAIDEGFARLSTVDPRTLALESRRLPALSSRSRRKEVPCSTI